MTSMNLLIVLYVFLMIGGFWDVEGRRPSKRRFLYNYDDDTDVFGKQSDWEDKSKSRSYDNYDVLDESLDNFDLDFDMGNDIPDAKYRSQNKPQRKWGNSYSSMDKKQMEPRKPAGDFDFDFKLSDEENDQQH
ncbi:uncharacterized protein LOC108098066 [Drosophila ficusphila]|uniref:uncharacterized protein LOC108098066 n=1 Tax=Drosophila ficusphila TaxID=30025 RepID=UPI0007E719E3|nr:uncharacterized protein LOC108098066 [Drosophila ficusphila]